MTVREILPAEQQRIRDTCFHPTGTFIEFERDEIEQSIPDRFEQQVRRYPHRLAVKTKTHKLTYDELDRAANRVAHDVLAQRGDGEEPIGLLFEHGGPVITAILGVLKAGKFYVPLDPSLPRARNIQILEDSQASLVLTNTRNRWAARDLARDAVQLINIDELPASLSTGDRLTNPFSDSEKWANYGGFQLPTISCVRNWTFLAINPTV